MDYFSRAQEQRDLRIKEIRLFLNNIIPQLQASNQQFSLEIGCGHGHWLTSLAEKEPFQYFIGIDLITKRIQKAVTKSQKRNLLNISFLKADAIEFISAINDDMKLRNIYIMFPDPWPKARHHKRRLVKSEFLKLLIPKTLPHTKLYFRTDHLNYFEESKNLICESAEWIHSNDHWPDASTSFFQQLLPDYYSLTAKRG